MNRFASERPLWTRWLLAVGAFSLLTVIIVLVVRQVNHGGATSDVQAAREADRQDRVLIAQDQAPRAATLIRRVTISAAVVAAISGDVRRQVESHQLAGPAGAVRCRAQRAQLPGRVPYRCLAESGAVSYPFFAVVDVRARRLVWCRQDLVQGSGLTVALDPGCLR